MVMYIFNNITHYKHYQYNFCSGIKPCMASKFFAGDIVFTETKLARRAHCCRKTFDIDG